jgi:Flp pilus assembly pilin Flp
MREPKCMSSNPFQCRSERAKRGQTLVEYALILAIISIVAIAMMLQLTGNVRQIYSNIDSQVARSSSGS